MTDETATASTDWLLEQFVEWANNFSVEIGMTLMVRGTTISGTTISGATYFKIASESFSKGAEDGSVAQAISMSLAKYTDIYPLLTDAPPSEPDKTPREAAPEGSDQENGGSENIAEESVIQPAPSFIHLKDAKIFAPGAASMPTNGGVLWRGKISEIDGFWIGKLSATVGD